MSFNMEVLLFRTSLNVRLSLKTISGPTNAMRDDKISIAGSNFKLLSFGNNLKDNAPSPIPKMASDKIKNAKV